MQLMPKNKSAATRYRVIDQMLNDKRKPFPNLEQMAAKCSSVLKTDVSTSTIEKDIRAMREEAPMGYSAPIVYSKVEGGYVYGEIGFSIAELNLNEEEWSALQFASQLLYQYKEVPIFSNFKNAIERINTRFALDIDGNDKVLDELVQFEKSVHTKGMYLIEIIYEAIKNKQAIQFQYKNIYKGKSSAASLIPYLIKENRNRWYVIGWSTEKEKYITYALDRMSDVNVLEGSVKKRSDFNATSFFQHSAGIMESNTKPEVVLLTILKPISDLALLEPLHATQKLIIEKSDRVQISLKVLVNEEFMFKILGMGSYCIVDKPASLRKSIKGTIQQMNSNYK
jgi:predicted DNA-binding transcriptional regulator YafY